MSALKKILRTAITAVLLFGLGFALSEWLATSPRFDLSQIEYPRALREENNMPVVEIFFATNRAPASSEMDFSSEAAASLSYGIAEVRIPERFRLTDVQRPEISRGFSDPDWARILRVQNLTSEEFQKKLQERLMESGSTRATLFVHGIQNTFDSTIRQAGTLAFGLNLPQPMVVFSWATDPGLSPAAYARCRNQVPAAAQALTQFLQTEGADNFDILAHSLGCKVVCAALAKSESNSSPAPLADPLPNVILVAPDVDKEDFGSVFLTPSGAAARHTTVYVARNDNALVFSAFLNGAPRAGAGINPTTHVEALFDEDAGNSSRVEIVDATFVNNAHTSHGYFYQNRAAFADLQNLLRNDLPACQRQLPPPRAREARELLDHPAVRREKTGERKSQHRRGSSHRNLPGWDGSP